MDIDRQIHLPTLRIFELHPTENKVIYSAYLDCLRTQVSVSVYVRIQVATTNLSQMRRCFSPLLTFFCLFEHLLKNIYLAKNRLHYLLATLFFGKNRNKFVLALFSLFNGISTSVAYSVSKPSLSKDSGGTIQLIAGGVRGEVVHTFSKGISSKLNEIVWL